MLRVMVVVGIMFIFTACNNGHVETEHVKHKIIKEIEENSTQIKIESIKKGILMNRPSYSIKIKAVNTLIIVNLNGERVWAQFNRHQLNMELPVNQWLTSGSNKLEVLLLAYKQEDFKLSENSECSVQLQIKEAGDYKTKPQLVSQIVYKYAQSTETTLEGDYNSSNAFKSSSMGDVHISKLERRELNESRYGEKVVGLGFIQHITLQTPFPRWKFLDSDNLVEGTFTLLSDDEYEKVRESKAIQEAYQKYQEIRDALKEKDLDKVMSYFTERSEELDIAFYEEEGYKQRILRKGFKEDLENYNLKLNEDPLKECWAYISDGGKTIFIKDAITFSKIIGKGYNYYDMRFRLEKGEWIITR